MMTTINLKATIAACTEFGSRIGEKLNSREGDAFDIAFKEAIAELSSKPLTKKTKSSSPKKTSASKLATIAKLTKQIQELGGNVEEGTGIGDMRAMLKTLKANKRAEEMAAKKAAKAEALKAKKEKKAQEKAAKAANSPSFSKDEWRTAMFPNEKLGKTPEWAGKNGSRLRIAIHKTEGTVKRKVADNWTDKAIEKFNEMFPEGKYVAKKKITKKKITKKNVQATLQDEQAALIAALVSTTPLPQGEESKNNCENPEPESKVQEKIPIAEVTEAMDNLTVEEDKKEEKEEEELVELEEEELVEIEEEEIEEVEEPDFPGEEEVDSFEHDSLNQWSEVDFYKNKKGNDIWDENMEFVGFYDDSDNTITFKEDYEPEE